MASSWTEAREKLRKDRARVAVALAMQNRWGEAVEANMSILSDFPDELEAYNRLGKALTEEGRVQEAKDAFRKVLERSPQNGIARKNLERLTQLDEEEFAVRARGRTAQQTFIEESGKAGVTSLINLARPKILLKEAPGQSVRLRIEGGGLKVIGLKDAHLGQVEPRLASRLIRLVKGGNRYEAAVTSVAEDELSIIVREVYQHPSQTRTASFRLRGGASYGVYLPGTILGYDVGEDEGQGAEAVPVKDWSNDDTEPGDDDAFSPTIHRIISAGAGNGGAEEDA